MRTRNLLVSGAFDPIAVDAISTAYEDLLARMEIASDDPLAANIAQAIINAAAGSPDPLDPQELQTRALNMLFPPSRVA
jgi:hypothetical protein